MNDDNNTIVVTVPTTLKQLYEKLSQWLYLTDTNHIDIALATMLSIDSTDSPLWVFILGDSGDGKTTVSQGLENPPKVILLDQITPNTLASGMKNVHDLGETLQDSSHVLLILDLACFSTLNTDDKKLIWGQFRTMHDGKIIKRTGNDVSKYYKDCHVAMLACGVYSFKNEQIVKDQLGTRELIYTIPKSDAKTNLSKVRMSFKHKNLREIMNKEIKNAMQGFLQSKKFDVHIETPPHIMAFIEERVFDLAIFRATAQIDYYEGEIYGTVDKEVPTRVAQQLDLLYRSLHSLDKDYPDDKFKTIVNNIVKSSSVPLRKEIYEYFVNEQKKRLDEGGQFSVVMKNPNQLSQIFNKSRKAIKIQCLILLELGILTVRYELEKSGYGSFEQDVAYYSLAKNAQQEGQS